MYVNFNILNQLGSPSLNSNTFANRPAAGQVGRLFIATDTLAIYRDNGTSWDQIGGGSGISGSGTAGQVTYWNGTSSVTGESAFTYNASTNQLRVDGNISMATDAEPWSDLDAIQIYNASFAGYLNNAYMSANAYYDGNDWIYIDSSTATWYSQTGGTHTWARATSGTAGTTIGWITGMILDSNSRLGVNAAPSDWLSTYKNVQLPYGASFYSRDNGTTVGLTSNAYLDNVGAGSWQRFTTGTAARYEMNDNSHAWYVAPSGSGAITYTNSMILDSNSNLGLNVTPSSWITSLRALQLALSSSLSASTSGTTLNISNNGYIDSGSTWRFLTNSVSSRLTFSTSRFIFNQSNNAAAGQPMTWTAAMELTTAGNLIIGTTTDAGYKLDVAGTAQFQDSVIINKNINNTIQLAISNTTPGSNSRARIRTTSTSGYLEIGKNSSSTSNYRIIATNDSFVANYSVGDLAIYNDLASGKIKFGAGGTATAHATIFSNGNTAIGTTTDSGFKFDVSGSTRMNGTVRIDGQTAVTAGANSGLHLIVNCDGTDYKIALLNV